MVCNNGKPNQITSLRFSRCSRFRCQHKSNPISRIHLHRTRLNKYRLCFRSSIAIKTTIFFPFGPNFTIIEIKGHTIAPILRRGRIVSIGRNCCRKRDNSACRHRIGNYRPGTVTGMHSFPIGTDCAISQRSFRPRRLRRCSIKLSPAAMHPPFIRVRGRKISAHGMKGFCFRIVIFVSPSTVAEKRRTTDNHAILVNRNFSEEALRVITVEVLLFHVFSISKRNAGYTHR